MEQLSNHYVSYQEFKQVLDEEMTRMAVGFVRIGFLLNYAEDTNIVAEGGYNSVEEFVKAEYDIDASQISRFARIYERFGEPGMPRLKTEYMNHGVAKLGIMLTLPDYINEKISENYSKSEITAIKREVEAEAKISDIEVEIEKAEMKDSVQYTLPDGLQQAVYQLIHDKPEVYAKVFSCTELEVFKEKLAPMREDTYFVRIKGVGRVALFCKTEGNITLTNIREGSSEEYDWQQLFDAFKEYSTMGKDAVESWCNVFQELWPLEEKKEAEKPKKESRVKVAEPKKEKKPAKSIEPAVIADSEQVDEQLPGQDSILNHPELLPDDMKEDKQEVLTGEVENITADASQITANEIVVTPDNDNVQQDKEGMKVEHFAPVQNNDVASTIRGYKAGIRAALTIMEDKYKQEDWSSIYVKASDIAFRAKNIMELEGKSRNRRSIET